MSEEALQIAEERREVKDRGARTRYTQLNAEFQRRARRDAGVQLQQPGIQPEEMNGVGDEAASQFSFGLPVYFKFKILFYTFTKTLGQRFDIFSSPSPRFIISINHCCSSEFLLQ